MQIGHDFRHMPLNRFLLPSLFHESDDLFVLCREQVSQTSHPTVGPHHERLDFADIVSIKYGEPFIREIAQLLYTKHIRLPFFDCLNQSVVVQLCHKLIGHQTIGIVWIVVQHNGNMYGTSQRSIVSIELVFVGREVPGRHDHYAICTAGFRMFGKFDGLFSTVSSSSAKYLCSALGGIADDLIDYVLLRSLHGDKLP